MQQKDTKLEQDSFCKYCDSPNLSYSKCMGYGEKMGVVYHYKIKCNSCSKSYHTKRTPNVYDKVKDQHWKKSKSYNNKFN
jgi:hypothetical protein